MSGTYAQFWSTLPKNARHPCRDLVLEAFWYVGEPLSAIDLVDVLDGEVTMWEAAHHLRALHRLGVVKPDLAGKDPFARRNTFDLPFRLTGPTDRRSR
jgi:hypothetical protein